MVVVSIPFSSLVVISFCANRSFLPVASNVSADSFKASVVVSTLASAFFAVSVVVSFYVMLEAAVLDALFSLP